MQDKSGGRILVFRALFKPDLATVIQGTLADDIDETPRYAPQAVWAAVCLLVGGQHALALPRMATLLLMLHRLEESYVSLLVGPPVSASGFRTLMRERLRAMGGSVPGLDVRPDAVTLEYSDRSFELAYEAMPHLAALLALIAEIQGLKSIDALRDAVTGTDVTLTDVQKACNGLAKDLNAYIDEQTLPKHDRHKLLRLVEHLEGLPGGRNFTVDSITDEVVWDFWLQHSADGSNFKQYRTVVRDYRRFACYLVEGAAIQAARHAENIEGTADGRRSRALAALADEGGGAAALLLSEAGLDDPVTALTVSLEGRVKVLPKGDWVCIGQYLPDGAGCRLMLSRLRSTLFGDVQNRLSQSLKDRKPAAHRADIIAEGPETDYREEIGKIDSIAAKVREAHMATAHILFESGHEDTLATLLEIQPELDMVSLRDSLMTDDDLSLDGTDENDVGNLMARVNAAFLNHKRRNKPLPDDLATLMTECARAASNRHTKGYNRPDWEDPAVVDMHARAARALPALHQQLATARAALERVGRTHAIPEAFGADCLRFAAQFRALYDEDETTEAASAPPQGPVS